MEQVTLKGKQTTGAGVFESTINGVQFNATIPTSGDGFWSSVARDVKVTGLSVPYMDDDEDAQFGELRVFFDLRSWDTMKHGLIYTDSLFIKELRGHLNMIEVAGDDVDYSEQGMQGDNYVSFDVGAKFLKSWKKFIDKQ